MGKRKWADGSVLCGDGMRRLNSGAGLQGKGKNAVSSWHRTEMSPEVGWKVEI